MERRPTREIGAIVLGLSLYGACAAPYGAPLSEEGLRAYDRYVGSLGDPYKNKRLLKDKEFLAPPEVLAEYDKAVERRVKPRPNILGLYIKRPMSPEENEDFRQRLLKNGFSEKDIEVYASIFSRPDIIVINQTILEDSRLFQGILTHERFHKQMKRLPMQDYMLMRDVAMRIIKKIPQYDEYLKSINGGWEELYTKLLENESPTSLNFLREASPRAYSLYTQVRDKAKGF